MLLLSLAVQSLLIDVLSVLQLIADQIEIVLESAKYLDQLLCCILLFGRNGLIIAENVFLRKGGGFSVL
jgi:hypothetical protein